MKIYKDKTGKIIIDGENNTTIEPKAGERWVSVEPKMDENNFIITGFIIKLKEEYHGKDQ